MMYRKETLIKKKENHPKSQISANLWKKESVVKM